MTDFARISRLIALALVLVWTAAAVVPARAQFFQFFDNRPTKRPSSGFWGGGRPDNSWGRRQDDFWGGRQDNGRGNRDNGSGWRQADGGAPSLRRRHRPNHERPRAVERRDHREHADRRERIEHREHADRKERIVHRKMAKIPEPAKIETAKPAPASPPEGSPPPYEPQLLRLSEIMGALAFLQTLCEAPSGAKRSEDGAWRAQMESLMTAEGAGPLRRERLAGAYNHGLHGYEYNYRVCTANARLARERFLTEGAQLAHDISAQYRAN